MPFGKVLRWRVDPDGNAILLDGKSARVRRAWE